MSISAPRSQWIWTPLLGWALLSCGVSVAWAQSGAAPSAAPSSGTGAPATSGAPAADVRSVVPGADTPAIDPTTGLPLVGDFNTPGSTGGNNNGVRSSVTPTTSVQPSSTLPALTPQTNSGASVATPNLTTLTTLPAANEVTSLPSFGTTIVNAPFGASGAAPVLSSGGGGSDSPEIGITVGSFRLFPAIEINVGTDNNVFAQAASAGPISSLYTTIAPSLDLRSDWLNHALHIGLNGVAANYNSASTQNYQNFTLQVDGKIDIHTDFFVTWSAAYARSSEPLGTPNAVAATSPTIVNAIPLKIGVSQKIGRFFYEANGTATHTSFTSNTTPSSAALTPEARERDDYGETFRFGYDFFEDLAFFIQPAFNQVRYVQDSTRNADGQNWSIGTSWKPSLATSLEATVGYLTQRAADGTVSSGLGYGLSGTWNGYAPLTLRPSIQRSVTQTALVNFTSALTTTYGLDFNYLIHDAWTATGGLSVTTSDYSPSPGADSTAKARTDYFYRFQIGLLYSLRPQVQIGPFFEYDTSSTTDPTAGPTYDRQIFSVRLIARR